MRVIKKNTGKALINEKIFATEVRLIGAEGEKLGVVSRENALEVAQKSNMDLVQMSGDNSPPVCKVMDYGKFIFDAKKKKAASKKNQKRVQVKEIKFRPGTEQADYHIKLKRLIMFLENGDKTKVTLQYRGREMVHKDIGIELLRNVEEALVDYGIVEQRPKFEGRQAVMVLAPIKKKI